MRKWYVGISDMPLNLKLLTHAGEVSHEMAMKKSNNEYRKFKNTLKAIDKEQNLREIEEDIKRLKRKE